MRTVDFPLYLVTDRTQTAGRPLDALLRAAFKGGLRAVQLREKDLSTRALLQLADELLGPAREAGARLLVNDRIDVALALGTAGVHLRADGLPVSVARRVVGDGRLIGVSAHSSDEARGAEEGGADFVVLGPIYETASKRKYGAPIGLGPLEEAASRCRIPIFAIGGVTGARVRELRRAGAGGVAVISAILAAADVESATRELLRELTAPW